MSSSVFNARPDPDQVLVDIVDCVRRDAILAASLTRATLEAMPVHDHVDLHAV